MSGINRAFGMINNAIYSQPSSLIPIKREVGKQLFVENQSENETQSMFGKYYTDGKFPLLFSVLISQIDTFNEQKFVNTVIDILSDKKIDFEKKMNLIEVGLVHIFNYNGEGTESNTHKSIKSAIYTIFTQLAESVSDMQLFELGIRNVDKLEFAKTNNHQKDTLINLYIGYYISSAGDPKNEIGINTRIGEAFLKLALDNAAASFIYANNQPHSTELVQSWLSNMKNGALFHTIMELSDRFKAAPEVDNFGKEKNENIFNKFIEGLNTITDLKKAIHWSIRHLYTPNITNNNGVKIGALRPSALSFLGKVTNHHEKLLKTIFQPMKNVGTYLGALKDVVWATHYNGDTIAKLYFILVNSNDNKKKAEVIETSVSSHQFDDKMLPYLIHHNTRELRNPAHFFITDKDRVLIDMDKEATSYVFKYGVKKICKVEKICKGQTNPKINKQCEQTIEILYGVYRELHAITKLGLGSGILNAVNSAAGEPLEKLVNSGEFNFELYSNQKNRLARTLFGLNGAIFGSNSYSLGIETGIALDIRNLALSTGSYSTNTSFFFKLGIGIKYYHINTIDDDSSKVPFVLDKAISEHSFEGHTTKSDILVQAATITLNPRAYISIARKKMGCGHTLGLDFFFGYKLDMGYGWLKDKKALDAFETNDKPVKFQEIGNDVNYNIISDKTILNRSSAGMLFIRQGLELGLNLEYVF